MLLHNDYVYYISREKGILLERAYKMECGNFRFEYRPKDFTFDEYGFVSENDVLPSVVKSTNTSYESLVAIYGYTRVPKPFNIVEL